MQFYIAMYNNVRSSVAEKAAIAKALVRAAESTVDFVAISEPPGLISTGDEAFISGIGGLFKGGIRNLASNFMAKVSTAGGFARIGNTIANKQFDAVANALKMTKELKYEFRHFVESVKNGIRGGADNYSFKQLKELGREFMELYGKK